MYPLAIVYVYLKEYLAILATIWGTIEYTCTRLYQFLDLLYLYYNTCSGNIRGFLPYRSGTPCSECSEGLDFCVANLCSCEFPAQSCMYSYHNTKCTEPELQYSLNLISNIHHIYLLANRGGFVKC